MNATQTHVMFTAEKKDNYVAFILKMLILRMLIVKIDRAN